MYGVGAREKLNADLHKPFACLDRITNSLRVRSAHSVSALCEDDGV